MTPASRDAERSLLLFCVDPVGLGGVALRARAGPARDAWLERLRGILPADAPLRRVPLHINDERLLGGLDLTATLHLGRVVAQQGLLSESDGGVVVLAMAERLQATTAARIAAVMDQQSSVTERDGVSRRVPCRIGVVALDEGMGDDEAVPSRVMERLAFHVELSEDRHDADADAAAPLTADLRQRVASARLALSDVVAGDDIIEALCAAAIELGIASIRAPLLALKAALASAALDGRACVDERDASLAARLVLGPRATRAPEVKEPPPEEADTADADAREPEPNALQPEPEPEPDREPEQDPTDADAATTAAREAVHEAEPDPLKGDASQDRTDESPARRGSQALDDVILAAAIASIPARLLSSLAGGMVRAARQATAGRAGALQAGKLRGRPCGARRQEPRSQARLNVIETLRAAAPWQALRHREAALSTDRSAAPRIMVRREDFHVTRLKHRSETTAVFVVDASGSAALHRLAETKGAVELLLADCYVRRDSVAVIAFRGQGAELLLPPTRSLVRAKRSLAALPGGGGTPLASGIDAAATLAEAIARKGATPIVVLLTDGRANIARNGAPGRAQAMADTTIAAARLRSMGFATLLMDTSAQPQASARALAEALGARYVPLPHAAATALSHAVRDVATGLTGTSTVARGAASASEVAGATSIAKASGAASSANMTESGVTLWT